VIAGQRIPLEGPFYSTVLPNVDFETYSEAGYVWDAFEEKWHGLPGSDKARGLKVVGARVYVEHRSFRLLSVAWDLKDNRGPCIAYDFSPADLITYVARGGLIESHYSAFEFTVWNHYCVPKLGWPPLKLEQTRCSMAKARACGYPGKLEELCEVLGTSRKDPDGTRLLRKFSVPRNPTKKDPRLSIDPRSDPIDGPKLWAYNIQDSVSESDASEHIPDLPDNELQYWLMDQRINARGVQIDLENLYNCIAIVEQSFEKYGGELARITGGIKVTELEQLKGWLRGQNVHMADMQADSIDAEVEHLRAFYPGTPALRALEIRQILGSASIKKLFAMAAQVASDGRLHDLYSYHAAHTGLWTGNGPQPQNLYKGEWKDPAQIEHAFNVMRYRCLEAVEFEFKCDALQVVNNCLRSLFIAKPGHTLISSDYTSIQGVVLAVLANEEWRLEVYRTHGKMYEASIARMTGTPLEEILEYKTRTGAHHPLRDKGKKAELSGGFGAWIGGWKRFGADEYYDSDDELKAAILAWRAASPAIVEWWGGQSRDTFDWSKIPYKEYFGLEGAAISAVENPGTCYRARDIGFEMNTATDTLYVQLPSGRLIYYHTPRLEPSTREWAQPWEQRLTFMGYNTNPDKGPYGWIQQDLYGGVLCQNAVSGVARDIMAHGMINLESVGYSIVLHTHDEPVAEVDLADVSTGKHSIEGFEARINDLPHWAKGWPIAAKNGWMLPRYGKYD
jgi:DNA polymerase